jgi:uncharacterized LabA/DUF88 family protein
VFVAHEQKMVDTMLATDVMTAGQRANSYEAIVVISGDSDFVPPMLAAKAAGAVDLVQLRPRDQESSAYAESVLVGAGVKVV